MTFPIHFETFSDALQAYYSVNPTGGNCHIVLDDGNVKNPDLDFCENECRQDGDWLGLQIIEWLRMWATEDDRLAELGFPPGYFDDDDQPQ